LIYVVTSGPGSRFPAALALAESAAEALPGQRFVWLVSGPGFPRLSRRLESVPGAAAEPWLPRGPAGREGLSPAAEIPQAMLEIAARPDCTGVFYCALNVLWTSRPAEILDEPCDGDVLLVPALLQPQTVEGVPDRELGALSQGVFSHSFVAAKANPEGRRFLAWWRERLLEPRLGQGPPESWLNLAPAFFAGLRVLRHPRFNVGPGNLYERRLEGSFPRITIGGLPVAYFEMPPPADPRSADGELDPRTQHAFRSAVTWYEHRLQVLAGSVEEHAFTSFAGA
jgi:hypothetical protein